MYQTTLRNACHVRGTGLHSGAATEVTLLPAPPDSGVRFRVRRGSRVVEVPASLAHVNRTELSTCLARDGVEICTVEHLLAALRGLEIDNVSVLTHGPEVPVMDGSALPFVKALAGAGRRMQPVARKSLRMLAPLRVEAGDKFAELLPSALPVYAFEIDYPHPAIGRQALSLRLTPQTFVAEVAAARTFGFEADMHQLQQRGLALGGSLETAVGLGCDGTVLNPEGLRFPDEFVRHKILDAVGDLSLFGLPIQAEYRGRKSGHTLNLKLLQALAEHPDRWEVVSAETAQSAQAV